MSFRIMIVDGVATNRILLRAMLVASHHDVATCATVTEAAEVIARGRPDLVLLDICQEPDAALAFCARLAADVTGPPIPVIATTSGRPYCRHAPGRIAALRAGAADVLDKSTPDTLLQARIRSLIRASIKAGERTLAPDDDTPTCGFAEAASNFEGPEPATGSVALVTPSRRVRPAALRMLFERMPQAARLLDPSSDLSDDALRPAPDLFIIDGAAMLQRDTDIQVGADVFRLVSDLRSRALTRHAAILVILPDDQPDMAALALDLGSADVVDDRIAVEELAHRVRRIIVEKLAVDRHRDSVQSRLLAAVTDPLTGLSMGQTAEVLA
ncbi:MAG: response regulator, partial [Rubellimicrobium sp.]|nr:response regulator [Rubellimicrobium sp.]